MPLHRTPSNLDPGPWKEISLADGIRIVEAPDFESFSKFVNVGFGDFDCRYLWRGQKCAAWEITSGLARAGGRQEESHLGRFHNAVARCTNREYNISNKNPDQEVEKFRLWSLGQHHGLATPLTDWTIYPYVALFFAFAETVVPSHGGKVHTQASCTGCSTTPSEPTREAGSQCDFRAVYALNQDETETVKFDLVENRGMRSFREKLDNPPYSDEFKRYVLTQYHFIQPKLVEESRIPADVRDRLCKWEHDHLKQQQLRIFRPRTHDNHRIHSQGGWHVYAPDNMSVEAWVRASRAVINSCKIPLLTKIIIPNSERNTVLKCLNKMNVNYLSLFPDIEGATKHCNMALKESRSPLGSRDY